MDVDNVLEGEMPKADQLWKRAKEVSRKVRNLREYDPSHGAPANRGSQPIDDQPF